MQRSAARRRCWTRFAVLISGAIWCFNMRCTRSLKCTYACVLARRATRQPWRSRPFEARPVASRASKNGTSRPVRLLPTPRRRDAPRRPHRLGPELQAALCLLQKRSCARKQAHAATPGSAFTSTPKGSRRRPPPPAHGQRIPAGLAQPAITEATGGQTAARSLPAVPTSVAAAHPQKGPARNTADVRAHFRPAYHGLRYRRS